MIITRECINKNIVYHTYNPKSGEFEVSNYQDLVNLINAYKNLLIKNGAKVNETVLIAHTNRFNNLAAFIAIAELGLGCVITNLFLGKSIYYADSKLKVLLPINYFIVDEPSLWKISKQQFYTMVSDKVLCEVPEDFTENLDIWATEKTIHHLCTSSGTTGPPKRIEHTHEFTYAVSDRNTSYLGENIWITERPTHGSSLTTFYLPSILSKKTKNIYFCPCSELNKLNNINDIDSTQIVYSELLNEVLNNLTINTKLTIFSLSAVRPEWLEFIKSGKVKNIISLFGTSETSGPLMMQYGDDPKYAPDRFELLDDFYPIAIENGTLKTIIPVYNRHNNTQDIVEMHPSGGIKFMGRKDLIRINDLIIPRKLYDLELNSRFSNSTLTYDTLQNKIYLTLWYDDPNLDQKVEKFSNYLKLNSEKKHFIHDYDRLEYTDFLSGIKLDQEMLRDYYRKRNENNI